MGKLNCWEFMSCGKAPAGDVSDNDNACPIATETLANGLNGGVNGGRICWVVAESCDGHNNNEHKIKMLNFQKKSFCFQCEFRYKVMSEEGLLDSCRAVGTYLTNLRLLQKDKQPA